MTQGGYIQASSVGLNLQQGRQRAYNVTLRRVHATTVVVEEP